MPTKKKGAVIQRTTLSKVLKPFRDQFRAASRRPKGKMPSWLDRLSPELLAQVKAQAFTGDAAKLPNPVDIGNAVLQFWSR
jgi:hypothetical protein